MKNFRSILIYSVLILQFVISVVGGNFFSYAQGTSQQEDNSLCHIPSEEFQQFLDFSDSMITELNTTNIENIGISYYPLPLGSFSSKLLKYPEKGMQYFEDIAPINLNKVKRGINASIGAAYSSIVALSQLTTKDSLLGLSILFRKEAFARDFESIQDISNAYQQIAFDLITEDFWDKKIGTETATTLSAIMDAYTGEGKIFKKTHISAGTRYNTLVKMLMKLSGYMKNFIATPQNSNTSFSEFLHTKREQLIDEHGGLTIIPNEVTIETMTKKYNAIRGGVSCNSSLQDFEKIIKRIKGIAKDVEESREIVVESTERLRRAVLGLKQKIARDNGRAHNGTEEFLTDYQDDILRSVYGIDTTRITKGQGIGLSDIFSSSRNIKVQTDSAARKTAQEQIAILHDTNLNAKNIFHAERRSKEEKDKIKNMQEQLKYISHTKKKTNLKDTFALTTASILREQEKTNLFVQTNDLKPLTIKFIELSKIVHETRELIGTKQSQDSINKKLEEICEKQCSNKGSSSCRGTL